MRPNSSLYPPPLPPTGQWPATTPTTQGQSTYPYVSPSQAQTQQHGIYPSSNAPLYASDTNQRLSFLTPQSTPFNPPYPNAQQPYALSLLDTPPHGFVPQHPPKYLHHSQPQVVPMPQVHVGNYPPAHLRPPQYLPHTEPPTHTAPDSSSQGSSTCESAEVHHDSPPPHPHTPPAVSLLRSQTLDQLTQMFDTYEKEAVSLANRSHYLFDIEELQHYGALRTTRNSLMQQGDAMRDELLTRLSSQTSSQTQHAPQQPLLGPSLAPPTASRHSPSLPPQQPTATDPPPLFPSNPYQTLSPQPQAPGYPPPRSPWDTQQPPAPDPKHAVQPMPRLLDTPQPPMSPSHCGPGSTPQPPAQVPAVIQAPPVKATTWKVAKSISKFMPLAKPLPLTVEKTLISLTTCADRHGIAPALQADHRKHLPDALKWLADFDAPQAGELGLSVLLHYVESKDSVPEELAEAVLRALRGVKQWPKDMHDVGGLLTKLQQQPDQRYYEAVNQLIGRLLVAKQ